MSTIVTLLDAAADRHPDAPFLRTTEGELTYAQVRERSRALAAGLVDAGARPGEPVVLLMHNSLDQLVTWFALARAGAVHVPVNTALVGASLIHVLTVTGARLAVVDADLLPVLDAVRAELPRLKRVVVRGPQLDALAATTPRPLAAPRSELDVATVLFTSGTTGPAKGCMLSARYLVRQAQLHAKYLQLRSDDVLYAPFPLFHVDAATLTVVAALTVGATAAIGRRFSASRFWDEARAFDATVFNFLGATLTILWKQPPSERDREHRVRLAWGVPMPDWQRGFEARFGFPIYEVYGLTDGGVPVYDRLDGVKPAGSCGRVIDEYEVTVVAPDGTPLPAGATGEIAIRGREPGLVMNGYWAMPEATARTLLDGTVRTGDLGRLDAEGHLWFLGRADDAIRRRGENISAFEVEQVLLAHPDVVEAAAVGVASELTEQDVKAVVVLRPGATLTAPELRAHCLRTGPGYLAPRYLEVVDALPRTPTQKVEKFRLAQQGVTAATWDAEAD